MVKRKGPSLEFDCSFLVLSNVYAILFVLILMFLLTWRLINNWTYNNPMEEFILSCSSFVWIFCILGGGVVMGSSGTLLWKNLIT